MDPCTTKPSDEYVFVVCRDALHLDDLTQDVYVRLWSDDFHVLRLWKQQSPLQAYLYRVIVGWLKMWIGRLWEKSSAERLCLRDYFRDVTILE